MEEPDEIEHAGFDWRTLDWKIWLARVLVMGLVLWVVAGAVRTAIQVFASPGLYAYVPLGLGRGALATWAEWLVTMETIAFRAWVAAGILLGFIWLRRRSV